MGFVITIDGPAASGKTSVSRELARRLGWNWVSTGAFYRGLSFVADQLQYSLQDESALAALALSAKWRVEMSAAATRVWLQEVDVTEQIQQEKIGNIASLISQMPQVRKALLQAQRNCQKLSQQSGLIAEGRDCGTVVFPQADLKIYLTARQEERAQRRAQESGESAQQIEIAQKQRDQQDSTRSIAPLQVPASSYVVDTSTSSFAEVVQILEDYIKKNLRLT